LAGLFVAPGWRRGFALGNKSIYHSVVPLPHEFQASLVLVLLVTGAASVVAASKAGKAATPKKPASAEVNKKPELRVDPTAISEGKSSVVTSYADIVEPVQKAVVSIYSTKFIKERLQVNPLLRQWLPGLQDLERDSKQEGWARV
jgi:S1-C subfamily serine protease